MLTAYLSRTYTITDDFICSPSGNVLDCRLHYFNGLVSSNNKLMVNKSDSQNVDQSFSADYAQ